LKKGCWGRYLEIRGEKKQGTGWDCIMGSYTSCYSLTNIIRVSNQYLGKGKAVPLQAWSGPEDSRKLRFPDFMSTAQDGGKVVSLTHRPPLPPRNSPGTHFF